MNEYEVHHLVENIIATWPAGPRGRIWTELLKPLDHARAHTAYIRCRNDQPTITTATFIATYRACSEPAPPPRALEDADVCTFARGIQVAWAAYQDECERLGREPNRGRFEHWL